MKKDTIKRRSFACNDAEWAKLLRASRKEDRSVSKILRRLIASLPDS